MIKTIIIDNSRKKSLPLLKHDALKIIKTSSAKSVPKILRYAIKNKFNLVIAAGGDGTVNSMINAAMKIKKNERDKLSFSALPCGKANDLARSFNLVGDLNSCLSKIINGKIKKLDIIKVNHKYFITGGGFGLPAYVVKEKEKCPFFKSDLVYVYSVLRVFLRGYQGLNININGEKMKKLMLVSVMNQPFIGKRFFLSPDSKMTDSYFEVCILKKRAPLLGDLLILGKVLKRAHLEEKGSRLVKLKRLRVRLDKKMHFMGDGELLEYSNKFDFEIVPKSLNFLY